MKRRGGYAVLLLLLSIGLLNGRTFTSSDGKQIEAEVVSFNPADGRVVIRLENNQKFTLPIDRFSRADQQYIQEWREEYDRSFVKLEFMTLRVRSSRVIFLIDSSGSMQGERWDKVTRNLNIVIDNLEMPSDFNVILFGTRAKPFRDDLTPANADNKLTAMNWLKMQSPGGGTPTESALRMAFESKDVETIILLSDGYPSTPAQSIIDKVARWQSERENTVTIHTIAYQAEVPGNDFMKDLAAANNGKFIRR